MDLENTFKTGRWCKAIEVKDFVTLNITPYTGDHKFLEGPTARTSKLWDLCKEALKEERQNNGLRDLDVNVVSGMTAFEAGYIDKESEVIVGLQTDKLLKRAMKPYGGYNVVKKALSEHGLKPNPVVHESFSKYTKTHNDGVFDAYTDEIRKFRSLGFLTGLPDNYARGRIIGDYRRVPLYGINRLIEAKKKETCKKSPVR